jgi:hypothetical protein
MSVRTQFFWIPLLLAACSSAPVKEAKVFPAGDKATAGPLVYAVLDGQVARKLGSGSDTRTPQNRFYILRLSVSNTSGDSVSVPPLTLVDDSGKSYSELVDGAGVPDWIGLVRKIPGNETLQGNVVFDAPVQHYKLRLTEPEADEDVSFDIPVSLVHEEMQNLDLGAPAIPDTSTPNRKK